MKNIFDIQEFQQFHSLEFIAANVVEGFITGLHKSPFHGFSVEFSEHRLYNQGESTKHIDWRLFARTDKLFVKRFEEETNLRTHLILDVSSSMRFPFKEKNSQNKLAFSIFCSAALIYLLRKQRDAVGLTFISDKIDLHTESKMSALHSKMLYNELEKLFSFNEQESLQKQTNLAFQLHLIAENIHKRSLVILFSDMRDFNDSESLFSALQHLRYNKHEVILFYVTDKKREIDFHFENRPYKFIDMETGATLRFNPNEMREVYVEKMKNFYDTLKSKCGQYRIDFVEADASADFKDVLIPYLLKRNKLF